MNKSRISESSTQFLEAMIYWNIVLSTKHNLVIPTKVSIKIAEILSDYHLWEDERPWEITLKGQILYSTEKISSFVCSNITLR